MSVLLKCDICGKNQDHTKTTITNQPLKLVVKNYKGRRFNVYVNIGVQDSRDAKMIDKMMKMNEEELEETVTSEDIEYKTPNPLICETCKKMLLTDIAKKGKLDAEYDENGKIIEKPTRSDFMEYVESLKGDLEFEVVDDNSEDDCEEDDGFGIK